MAEPVQNALRGNGGHRAGAIRALDWINARDRYRALFRPSLRPFLIFIAALIGLTACDWEGGRVLSAITAFSTLQYFSTVGLVALGLGLTMVIGEFDLSVSGVFGLGGCVGVLAGNESLWLGIGCALGVGLAFGLAQGTIISRFGIGSVPVTLGGLLTASGLAFVVTQNRTVSFDDIDIALALNEPIARFFSIRSLIALVFFAVAAFVFLATRLGRDLVATGSNRRAAIVSGVPVGRILVGSFAFSATTSALGGALLSYSLASASPAGLADVLVPAITTSILGGISLAGGIGNPIGLAVGVITLALLRSGMNALAAPPYVTDIASGLILLAVAISDAPLLLRRILPILSWLRVDSDATSRGDPKVAGKADMAPFCIEGAIIDARLGGPPTNISDAGQTH
jgi:ribose/xylose/arabinose/galactoside ABC-type transport system permease subunit